MLKVLQRIVKQFASADSPEAGFQQLVCDIRDALATQAVSLFLLDTSRGEYVLMATDGLKQEAVGQVRLRLDKSLVSLVGRREEPINIENAKQHQEFLHYPGVGEEAYAAFLGVPIIHQRRLLGVIAVHQEEERRFDESEEAFLVTLSAQIADGIALSEASGALVIPTKDKVDKSLAIEQAFVTGVSGVSGVAIGEAVVVYPVADLDAVPSRECEDIDAELALFDQAIKATRQQINELAERMQQILPEDQYALFDVYLKILEGESLNQQVHEYIRAGQWAQGALRQVVKQYVSQFEAMSDPYLRERASDFRDLGRRILAKLQAKQVRIEAYPQQTILVGDEVTAANLAEVPEGQLAGIVSGQGSANAHVAILARSLGIPTVMGAQGAVLSELSDKQLIVDGYYGQVYVNPSKALLNEYRQLALEEQELTASLAELRSLPAETPDGHKVSLYVNTGMTIDAGLSLSVGAQGVGLYRTEVPFMSRERFPSEEEQRVIYRQLLKAFSPSPVTMRLLDVGGDKQLSYFPINEVNPYLGWRGIRITLDHPEVFLMQVRAMLRANSELNNLQILLPMISSVGEFEEAVYLIRQAHQELLEEQQNVAMPPIGVMIEVPAAVYQARELAKRADYLSVGSNDLTQYILAVDRNNPRVASLYDPLHPAVISALAQVVEAAHAEGKPVGMCGEMASDPLAVILLLALGFDSMSMNSASLPRAKWVIRSIGLSQARKLLSEILTMHSPNVIRFHLEKALDEAGLGGLIRAGKS